MKTIILALFVCISAPAFGVAYVPPNIYAKQYLAELDLKETLIKVWSNKANCLANLNRPQADGGPATPSEWRGTLDKITEGSDSVFTDSAKCSNPACTSPTDCANANHRCNGGPGGTAGTWTKWRFKNSNIHVVKMELTGDDISTQNDIDRTFTVYYIRDGLEDYRLNTIDNRACSDTSMENCYKAQCSLNLNKTSGSEECKSYRCCQNCWSITGGF